MDEVKLLLQAGADVNLADNVRVVSSSTFTAHPQPLYLMFLSSSFVYVFAI